ncbi:hypothetical protein BpHYR1_048731 [Brachionus plicatilis]|uniref:Uncharacterized protein n=1 Tax=Brachionus plicatilis TaxID=10195 RepID=A0A3M7Q822_BRAPC|nr:hypothetical protein BpHYR1_048731 [Brachionus plicatilis]
MVNTTMKLLQIFNKNCMVFRIDCFYEKDSILSKVLDWKSYDSYFSRKQTQAHKIIWTFFFHQFAVNR